MRNFTASRFQLFRPYWTDQIDQTGEWRRIESRRQERELCERHGMTRIG